MQLPANTPGEAMLIPTPVYNSGVLMDMMTTRHSEVLLALFERVPVSKDAVLLLKVTLVF